MRQVRRDHTWFRYFLQVLFTALVYFLLARISLLLQFESSNATPVWPSSGFALAIVLLWGMRMAPGIFFAAFAANFLVFISNQTLDYPQAAILSLIIAIGNTAEPLIGSYLLSKVIPNFHLDTFLEKVEEILRYSAVAALMCIAGASIGTLSVFSAKIIPDNIFPHVWLTWWLGDFSGVLLVTSFILIWLKSFTVQSDLMKDVRDLKLESIVFFIIVVITGGVIFDDWLISDTIFRWPYWIIPVLVWAALRFSQREVITALVIYSAIAIWGTVNQRGPFSILTLNESLLVLQAFIAIMVITKLSLNVSILERRKTEAMLRKTGDELEIRVKKRTSQLEERNEFVESILNSSFDSIIVLDKELRCISINRIAKNHLRLPYPENVIGKKLTELPSFLLPNNVLEDINKAFEGEAIHREKFASPISEVYFEMDYIPLKNQSGVYAVMIVGHDITQSIHAAEEIREQKNFAEMLIENSPYMIMALDKSLYVTAWNKKSEEHTGLTKDEVIGKPLLNVFPEYNNETWVNTLTDVLTNGNSYHFPRIDFISRNGWGECFIAPLYNSHQTPIGLLSITQNITELVNATNELEERNKDLQKRNEELSSFAYVASHDLQEPLRKIQIFSKRIVESEEQKLSTAGKDYFNRMKDAAERMQLLIEDLLAYSRTGSLEGDFEKISLKDIVNEVQDTLRDMIQRKNAVIIAEDLCTCIVIRFQFQQLLLNLITNSLKFSKKDVPPVITIKSRIEKGKMLDQAELEKESSYCHIVISDNGIGFEPEFNDQIFGLFQRLHGKKDYPGTGIGLAICKKIVENHKGMITASGEPGKGATFNIYIPHERVSRKD